MRVLAQVGLVYLAIYALGASVAIGLAVSRWLRRRFVQPSAPPRISRASAVRRTST